MRYGIGATYQYNDRYTFRAGVALDESPVSTSNRTLRIPDGDRIWLSIGTTIKLNECYKLDLGYSYLFGNDISIKRKAAGGNEDLFTGKVSGHVHVIGVGISGTF